MCQIFLQVILEASAVALDLCKRSQTQILAQVLEGDAHKTDTWL